MGRVSEGVRGIRLGEGDHVVGMVVVRREDATLLVVSEGGMGKRTEIDAYRLQTRGGKGVINLKTSEKTGEVVAIKSVVPEDELMVITRKGVINRQRIDEIRVIGRATQGVRLVNLDKGDVVMDVASVISENGDEDDPDAEGGLVVAGEAEDIGSAEGASEGTAEAGSEAALDVAAAAAATADEGEDGEDELDSEDE